MVTELDSIISPIPWVPAVIGAIGGFTAFLYAISTDKIKNNKTVRKCTAELLGGSLVAFFFAQPITQITGNSINSLLVLFVIGFSWATIIQAIRTKITKIVEAAIGEKMDK